MGRVAVLGVAVVENVVVVCEHAVFVVVGEQNASVIEVSNVVAFVEKDALIVARLIEEWVR